MKPRILPIDTGDPAALRETAALIRASYRAEAEMLGLNEALTPSHPAFLTEQQLAAMAQSHRTSLYKLVEKKLAGILIVRYLPKNVCEVARLCVSPEKQGQGIGVMLHEYALELAREAGCKTMSTNIAYENVSAITWCGKLGYRFENTLTFPGLPYTIAYYGLPVG